MTEQVPAVLSEAAEAPETVAAVVLDAPAATDATVSPVIPELSPAECAARLAALFPAVFTPGTPRPLKLRIQADVQQRAPGIFTKKTLSIFLHRHTTGNGYLKALANAPSRFDLDGQPAGEVSDEHRQAAAAEFDRRRRLHEERRAAERETRRLAYDQARRARAADPGPLSPDAPAVGAPPAALRADSGPRPRRAADDGHRDRAPTDAAPHRRRDGHEMRGSRRAGAQPPAPRTAGDPMPDLRPVTQRPADARSVPATPPVARPVMDEAQRARAALLHAFETTTLTRANFCALKGWSDADLEVALVEARREREQRGPVPRPNPAPQGAAVSRDAPQRPPRGDTGRRGPPGSPRPPR